MEPIVRCNSRFCLTRVKAGHRYCTVCERWIRQKKLEAVHFGVIEKKKKLFRSKVTGRWVKQTVFYCAGKCCYSKRGAITAKNKREADGHIKLRIYNCPECNKWHLTHKV